MFLPLVFFRVENFLSETQQQHHKKFFFFFFQKSRAMLESRQSTRKHTHQRLLQRKRERVKKKKPMTTKKREKEKNKINLVVCIAKLDMFFVCIRMYVLTLFLLPSSDCECIEPFSFCHCFTARSHKKQFSSLKVLFPFSRFALDCLLACCCYFLLSGYSATTKITSFTHSNIGKKEERIYISIHMYIHIYILHLYII